MPELLLTILHLLVTTALALALALPTWRPRVALATTTLGLLTLTVGLATAGTTRSLDVDFRYSAYEGARLGWGTFPVETTTAGGLGWAVAAAVFLLAWSAVLWLTRPARDGGAAPLGQGVHPFWVPLLLGWSGLALVLVWEKLAAPAGLVQPVAFERALLPPALAASALLATRLRRVLPTLLWLAVFVTAARLPLAIWGTLATRRELGTSLDVHEVTVFANPFTRLAMQVPAGSEEQLAWLVWGPQLFVFPGLYLLSLGGIAFAVVMWVLHGAAAREQQAEQRARLRGRGQGS